MDELDLLVAEPLHERHVLVRRRDEAGVDPRLVGVVPVERGQLLVLATPGAHEVPSLVAALPALLADFLAGIESVMVGVGGLAASTRAVESLAETLGVEIVAPDGGVAAMAGAALYAGHGVGGTGWYRSGEFLGARFPRPEWESWMPAQPVDVGGTVATPVPCGIRVGGDGGFDVPVNQRFPKVVVGAPVPSPADVAALLGELPDGPIMIVPATRGAAKHTWLAEVATRLTREVVFSAGTQVRTRSGTLSTTVPDADGNRLFRPFPLVLGQHPRDGGQRVLDIAAAPPGWEHAGRRSYRFTGGGAVAEVVPSGLVLRSPDDEPVEPVDSAAPFDPEGWTLTLGIPGRVVGLPVLAAAEDLLGALPAEQRAVVRVRMAGVLDEEAAHALDRRTPAEEPPPVSDVDESRPADRLVATPPAHHSPVTTMSATPVSTVSGVPSTVHEPAPPPQRRPRPTREPEMAAAADGQATYRPMAATRPRAVEPTRSPAEKPAPVEMTPPPVPSPVPSQAAEPRAAASARALTVPVRASTAAEQARFTSAAGDAFTEALATVNAAMATWPSMRDDSPGAKADYVAVCLFLGRGEAGAGSVNGALRVGRAGVLDGQIPCLMSGIRRLPTHRRPVLRQGKVSESLEHRSTPGTVLTEPGFLAGTVDLDVTVPGADLDVLIWPSTARRTSELLLGRPINEAVFLAGARFKALAVRTAGQDEQDEQDEDTGTPSPRVAVLFRELAPGETPTTDLDERDLAVLAKLDGVLARRHRDALRVVEDLDVAARLTTSMVAWQRATATAVAS